MKIFIKISFVILLWISFTYSQIVKNSYLKDDVSLIYPSMEITKLNNPSEDYLFLGLTSGGISNLLIVDNELTPVYYHEVNGIIYDFKFQPDGELTYNVGPATIYGMDSSGTMINQFYAPPGIILDIHELRVISDGTYYILGKEYLIMDMSQYIEGGDTAALVVAHSVIHMDANDNEIWRWRAIDHYNILDVDEYVDLTQHVINWTHCNSIEIATDGNILLSTRNFDEVTKIDRTTGDIIWRLGGEKNQFTFINDTRGFSRQHCVRQLSNGNLIMFDNGQYLIPEYSSLVEYEINETNFTATLVRRYTRNETVFSRVLGSVQELSNGHIIIGWGESQNPAVTEINEKDSIEFEMKFISNALQYRVYRFKWETNLFTVSSDSIDFGIVSIGDSSLTELILYNPKDSAVTIDECLINNNSFSVLNELPISIPSQDSATLNVMFKPSAEGYYQNKLNIRSVNDTMLIGKQVYLMGATTTVSVEDRVNSSLQLSLLQNFPNPFNPNTMISYQLIVAGNVSLKVYDILGNEVAILVNEEQAPGVYEVEFSTSSGIRQLVSGIYFYQIRAGSFIETKKMILLR